MPYESKFFTSPFENVVSGIHAGPDGTPVQATYSRSGVIPTKSFQRLGSNNPANGPLLAYLNKSKPLRVRSYIKKVIVGYRLIYPRKSRVYYVTKRLKKVFSHFTYAYQHRYYTRVNRLGRVVLRKKVIRIRHKHYRYVEVLKLKYRKVAVRVPIKVRTKVYFTVPPKVVSELPTGRPYLLPNPLTYSTSEIRVKPLSNSSDTWVSLFDDIQFLSCSTTGPVVSRIPFPGTAPLGFNTTSVDIGRGVSPAADYTPFLPLVDDIYLSATSLHGLYKKVASDVPSTLTSLAELPETLNAIKDILIDGIKLAKQLRRMDLRQAYKTVNSAVKARKDSLSGVSSKVWLSWYLAISPTISDVTQHIETFKREDRLWRKFSKSSTELTSTVIDNPSLGYASIVNTMTTIKWACIINGRMTIDEIKDKFTESNNQAAALYAVVPFSFIADWIVDVSSYLESAQIFQDLDYTAWKSSASSRDEAYHSNFIGYKNQPNQPELRAVTQKRNTFIQNQFRVDREPVNELPDMPLVPWKKQVVDETFINRSLTAASLFRVLSSRKN